MKGLFTALMVASLILLRMLQACRVPLILLHDQSMIFDILLS
jgi:hypothetical protein